MKPVLQRTQKSTESVCKWNGSKGSSVDAMLIGTNFETVPFGSSVNEVLIFLSSRHLYFSLLP